MRIWKTFLAATLAAVAMAQSAIAADTQAVSIWDRPRLLDFDWRKGLTEHGISIDAWLTQFYQGSLSGVGASDWRYGGKGDIVARFDGAKLGLWQGLSVTAHAELLYGRDANLLGNQVLLPVNTALAFPRLGGSDRDLSVVVTQVFNERVSASVGKFNMLDALARTPLLGGGGTGTFMNMALAAPVTGVIPPYLLGANMTVSTDPVIWTAFVYDPRSAQDEDVLRNPFSKGVTGMLSATVPYQLSGRSGFLSGRFVYSNKEGTDLSQIPDLILPGGSEQFLGTKKGGWFLGASFQQYLVQSAANSLEGWGVFGQFGVSDGNPNPIEWSALLGVGGTSFIPGRNLDRWGVGYFRYLLSSDLRNGLRTIGVDLRDEQGIEVFYNVAVTPWFSVTGDLQVVQPVRADVPMAVTASLRTRIRF